MKKILGFAFVFCALAFSAEAVTVTDVTASSRFPWKSVLDVDFTIGDAAVADLFRVEVAAKYAEGTKKIFARTYITEPICGRGRNRISWDAGADYPDIKIQDLQIAVTVHPMNADASDVYMVIDLSSGPESTRYPVRYTFTPPPLVPTNDLIACVSDPCRTTQMWLKRLPGYEFPFHASDSKPKGSFMADLSSYYIGIFEVTQKQWAQVMGTWPSKFTNATYRVARPVENINYEDTIGHNKYPVDKTVKPESFVGKMRARTGIEAFNLPTEAQWEGACRAGSTKTFNSEFSAADLRYKLSSSGLIFNEDTSQGTAIVGTYKPNKWGLYNMYDNVMEMCLDAYADLSVLVELYETKYGQGAPVPNPTGPDSTNATERKHATRGGCWYNSSTEYFLNWYRDFGNRDNTGTRHSGTGVRLVVAP